MDRAPDATDPPIRYGIPKRSRVSASRLSDLPTGCIMRQDITVNFEEQFRAETTAGRSKEDLALARVRILLTQARHSQIADRIRPFQYLLKPLGGREPSLQIQINLPGFR